eukprot:9840602-Heterocapsa_arctica.AAC.1
MHNASRIQTYYDIYSENIGDYPEDRAIQLYKPLNPGGSDCYDPSCSHNLELVAASAETRSKWVELWLVDTGCGHDLVNKSDALRRCKKLRSLVKNMPFQTANGLTVSTHSAPMRIEEL